MFDDSPVDRVPPRFESHADRAAYLLSEYKYGIYVAGAAVLVLVASGRLGLPELPSWWTTVLEGVAIGAIPAAILGKVLIIDPFVPDPRHDVLWIDLENYGFGVEKVPRNLWENRQRGDWPELVPDEGPIDFVVTKFEYLEDVDELVVEGVDEDLVNPVSILATKGRLEQVFGDLLEMKAEKERLEAQQDMRFLEAESRHVNSLMAAVQHGLEFDPGSSREVLRDRDGLEAEADDRDRAERTDDNEETPTLSDILPATEAATDGGRDR